MKILVVLEPGELREAAIGGIDRRISAIVNGRRSHVKEKNYQQQNWWQSDVVGAVGEYAVAKAFGRPWSPTVGRIDALDVHRYQVRSTEQREARLRVRKWDNPEDLYILAQVHNNRVLLHGYLPGHRVLETGIEEFPNCWSVPTWDLYMMSDLPEDICWGKDVNIYRMPPLQIQ